MVSDSLLSVTLMFSQSVSQCYFLLEGPQRGGTVKR